MTSITPNHPKPHADLIARAFASCPFWQTEKDFEEPVDQAYQDSNRLPWVILKGLF